MILMRNARSVVVGVVLLFGTACGGTRNVVPPGTSQPDKFLFDRGNEELKEENWLDARTYFQQIIDGYPQSPFRPESKLAIGDSYLGENTLESVVLAQNEFKEFLSFYPTSARADYAQYKLAMSHFAKMRAAQRDQSETREAVKEFEVFFERYPESPLTPEVKQKYREARDRLTEADYGVGVFYYKIKWYPGAIARFKAVLATDPGFSSRDGVYYYLGESLAKNPKTIAEAIPYFERLLAEFSQSEFMEDAKKRLGELKAQAPEGIGVRQ
jgi:outer membrane protein assembly factor BamD